MKLRDLNAHFTKFQREQNAYVHVDTLAEADGIRFLCPLCAQRQLDWVHPIFIGFEGRARPGDYGHNSKGQPVLWKLGAGDSLDNLSLTPSIQIEGGCNWHGFVGSSGVPPGEAA